MKNLRRHWLAVGCLVFGLSSLSVGTPTAAFAQEAAPAASSVTTTAGMRIAILPTVNFSGEKDTKQKNDQATKADEELKKQFSERGFDLISPQNIESALKDTKVNLSDEEYHNRATLYKVARAVGADYVAFVVITDVDQRRVKAPLTGDEMVGKAKTKFWLLKVADETPILNAARQESQARSNLAPSFDSGARLIRNSVAGAVRDSLKPFLQNYPKKK